MIPSKVVCSGGEFSGPGRWASTLRATLTGPKGC